MSWLKKSSVLVVTLVVMAFAAEARAGGHVDWSAYIDDNPSKPIASKPVNVVEDAPVAKSSNSKKRVAKKAAGKRKVKARAKGKRGRK